MTSQLFNNPLLFNAPDEGSVKIMFHVLCTQTRVPRDNSALLLDSAVVSTHYTSVKDGQTDAQTPYHSIYSAMHASRGKKTFKLCSAITATSVPTTKIRFIRMT